MSVTWPSSLPVAQRSGHSAVKGVATSRIRFAAGNSRVIQRTSEPPKLINLSWIMTETELNTFIDFYQGDGDFGAADIDGIAHQDATGLVVSGASGVGSLRFAGPFSTQRIGVELWQVSAQMERITENIVSKAAYFSGKPWKWNNGTEINWNTGDTIDHP